MRPKWCRGTGCGIQASRIRFRWWQRRTPAFAIVIQAIWACIYTITGSLEQLFTFAMFVTLIKYGFVSGDDYYVLKMASGFYNNPALGLPISDGLLLVFSQKTGELKLILLDKCWLTDMRTAAAGAVAAKHLAAKNIHHIGIVGTGVQARMQLEMLQNVVDCKSCFIWGRDSTKVQRMIEDLGARESVQAWGLEIAKDGRPCSV